MVDKLLTEDDFPDGITPNSSPSFNQNNVIQYNNVAEVSLDITTSATIAAGSEICRLEGNRYGRGTYFMLYDYSTGTPYLCRLTYSGLPGRYYYVSNVVSLPSGVRLVGNVVIMAHATN